MADDFSTKETGAHEPHRPRTQTRTGAYPRGALRLDRSSAAAHAAAGGFGFGRRRGHRRSAVAVLYTVGPHPYGLIALGDAMSFLFFGIVHEPDHAKFDRFMAPTSLGTVAVALVFTLCAVLG